jgi:serine/threonine protein kinase
MADIKNLLLQSDLTFFGFSDFPEKIRIVRTIRRTMATLYFCELHWGKECRRVCIKEFRESPAVNVARLYNLHEQLESTIQNLEISFPKLLDYNSRHSLIFMEFISGETLENRIARSFWGGKNSAEICFSALRVIAARLASFHQVEVPNSAIFFQAAQSNISYLATLEKVCQFPLVRACLPSGHNTVTCLLKNLSPQFWKRHERRLLLEDFQPKNILVNDSTKVSFIDINYGLGHPFLNVAHFLTQLARMRQRWLLPRADRMIRIYQDFFLEHYFQSASLSLQQDLPFFRLWSMVFSLIEQCNRHRLLRPYIQRFYCKEISQLILHFHR